MNNTANQARQHTFHNIPDELKARKQWVVWKHYQRDGQDKFTKVPWQLWDDKPGKIGMNQTTFDVAVQQFEQGRVDGIGFVFTVDDPYTGIDIDADGDAPAKWQLDAVEALNSYTELSPSGKGVHVIVKGDVPLGIHPDGIGIFSEDRYFTFTGNIVDGRDTIKARQTELNALWNTHKSNAKVLDGDYTLQQLEGLQRPRVEDDHVIKFVSSGANAAHWNGQTSDPSASYYSILRAACVASGDEAQVQRVVLSAPLMNVPTNSKETRPQKVLRLWDREYYPAAMRGAAERLAEQPWIEHGLAVVANIKANANRQQQADVQKILKQADAPKSGLPQGFETIPVSTWSDIAFKLPPGNAGLICQEILKRQRTPNPKFAVWALMGYLSGVIGRSYLVDGFHLRQFTILVSHSNTGKTSHWSTLEKMINKATGFYFADRIVIGGVASPERINTLGMDQPSLCLRMPDGGQQLLDIVNGRTGPDIKVRSALHSIYDAGQEGSCFSAQHSQKGREEKRVAVDQFNMSLVVDTTFEHALEFSEADFKDGLMSRMIVSYADEDNSTLQRPHKGDIPYSVAKTFGDLLDVAKNTSMPAKIAENQTDNAPIDITIPQGIDDLSWQLENEINDNITRPVQRGDLDPVNYIFSRIVLNTKTVAGLIAAINNPHQPVITKDIYEWAFKYLCLSLNTLVDMSNKGTLGETHKKELGAFVKCVVDQMRRTPELGGAKSAEVVRRLCNQKVFAKHRMGARYAVTTLMRSLEQDGSIVVERVDTGTGGYGVLTIRPVYESGLWSVE